MQSNIDKNNVLKHFQELLDLVAKLRDPISGCPWDLKQTHQTLSKYMIEEAYEAAATMNEVDYTMMCDELGDVLFQILLNAQIAGESDQFSIDDVLKNNYEKMKRRHPHVFGSDEDKQQREIPQIMQRWEEIKKSEKKIASSSMMKEAGVYKVFPATSQAAKIGKIASSIHFDWDNVEDTFDVLLSEIEELKIEIKNIKSKKVSPELVQELGDVYFSLAQVCRHLSLDPETVATQGNLKFLARFEKMEDLADKAQKKLPDLPRSELQKLWEISKN